MRRRWRPWALVALGIVASQVVLYGPSLAGEKLLLPLDLLSVGGTYLPRVQPYSDVEPQNRILSDQILNYEPARRFTAAEMRAGRLPLWTPYEFTGTPFAGWAKYSPFQFLYTLFPTPLTLAWIQLLQSLIAGLGAYLFCGRTVGLGRVASGIAGCCFPMTGYFVQWQGSPIAYPVSLLPWLLLATDATLRRPRGVAAPALALVTALVVVSGQLDMAGLVLLGSLIFAAWRLPTLRARHGSRQELAAPALGVAAGWGLGLMVSAVFWLPIVEYSQEGQRLRDRAAGAEERPTVGWSALPQIVMPEIYGSSRSDSVRIVPGNRLESSAAGYTGLVATLLLAPIGVCVAPAPWRLLWLVFALLGFAWQLGVPGLVDLLRLPGLNLLSYNRWVFLGSLAILALAARALDWLWRDGRFGRKHTGARRAWLAVQGGALTIIAIWLGYRSVVLPSSLPGDVAAGVAGHPVLRSRGDSAVRVLETFRESYLVAAVLCLASLLGWLGLHRASAGRMAPASRRLFTLGLGTLMALDLLWHGAGVSAQVEPRLDYPELPVLERTASRSGRILCLVCLPPSLGSVLGLRDIRGYDAVDPAALVEVLMLAQAEGTPAPVYARTQYYVPNYRIVDGRLDLPPVLDMLGLRHVLGRGRPPDGLQLTDYGDSYWVAENPQAAPRLWLPRRVGVVEDDAEMLRRLAHPAFDPATTAFVHAAELTRADAARLDPAGASGRAEIVNEVPRRIEIEADIERGGLLILADRWSPGWRATVDGEVRRVVRVDHVLRGVFLDAGSQRVVFTYWPRGFVAGLFALGLGSLALAAWLILALRRRPRVDGTADSAAVPSDAPASGRTSRGSSGRSAPNAQS